MSLKIIHPRGHLMSQQQLDVLTPMLNRYMHGEIKKKDFEAEIDKALEAAGCPVPAGIGPEGVKP